MSFWRTYDPFFIDPFSFLGTPNPLPSIGGESDALQKPSQKQQDMPAIIPWLKGPRLDLKETDKHYIIKADLPGLSKDQIQIHIEDNILTIEGERNQDTTNGSNSEKDKHHIVERFYGKFIRSVRLPEDAEIEGATAKMENGVLEL
ncbi:hypothetical protein HK102_010346, partial [Quaeritorhiza haematococci]